MAPASDNRVILFMVLLRLENIERRKCLKTVPAENLNL